MIQKVFIVVFLVIFSARLPAQSTGKYIYLGQVNCRPQNKLTGKTTHDSSVTLLGYHILNSATEIEIYLVQQSIGPFRYTREARLYYKNGFNIEYWESGAQMDSVTFQFPRFQKQSSGKYPADSVFALLVANGIFSLPPLTTREILHNNKPSVLTAKGMERFGPARVVDGSEFMLEFKVGSCYGRYIFNNPDTYHEIYPDNQLFRRQSEIIAALFLNF